MRRDPTRVEVLAGGIFGLVLAMGVARFSYTPLLPLMQKQAGLGIPQGGLLAAINYAGYLSGAIAASLISSQKLKVRLYVGGLVLAVLTTVMMGMSSSLWVWAVSRYFAGLSTSAGMVLGSGLILNWLIRNKHRSELGVHFAGVGVGIALCSVAVEIMSPALNWREQWYAFAVIGCVLLIPPFLWLPPSGQASQAFPGQTTADHPPSVWFMRIFMAAYFCAGIGYVVSATFIVSIVDGLPGMSGRGTLVFLLIGLAGAPACILWDLVARKTGDLNALIMASAIQVIGIILPIIPGGLFGALLGAVLFGGTVMGLVSLVLTMVGRYFPLQPAKMMGKMSIAYGAAQIVGPAVTGWLARGSGGYASGLYMAAGAMVLAALLLVGLRSIDQPKAAIGLDGV